MESCAVRSCINFCKYNANVELYPLPASLEEKCMWATAFGLTLFDLKNESTRICGNHFRRKYFLNKPEVKQNVNGSAPLLMSNTNVTNVETTTSDQAFTKIANSSAFPTFMALKNTAEPCTYRLHIPEVHNSFANVHYSSSSPNILSAVAQSSTASSSSQNVLTIPPNAVCSTSQNVLTIPPNAICSTSSQNVFSVLPNTICSNSSQNVFSVQPNMVCSSSQNVFSIQPSTICNSSSQNVLSTVQTNAVYSNSSQNVLSIKQSVVCNSSENVSTISNQTTQSNSISSEQLSSNENSSTEMPSTIDTCELFCKEENLTPEQEQFQREEWLNFVKFTAKLHNFPYVSAVNGSEIGEKVVDSVSSQELPVLVYTNVPQQSEPAVPSLPTSAFVPNAVLAPPVSSPVIVQPPGTSSNAPFICHIPSNVPVPLNSASPLIHKIGSPPVAPAIPVVSQNNTPSVIMHHTNTSIPVKLDKVNSSLTENPPAMLSKDEEIFPVVLQDSATENLLGTVNNVPFLPLNPICEISVADENIIELAPSPAFSVSSGNERYMSPDLLCNVEVNIEENGSPLVTENAPAMLGSENECDNFNSGPKIVDVLCGDAGANEFYKGIAEAENNKDTSQTQVEAVPSENSVMPKMVTQWSIFSMQKTIAVISSGTAEASVRNLLGLRIHIPPLNAERDIPTRLKNRLREEHFLTLTPWWMIQKRYLPTSPPCTKCNGRVFRLNSCLEFLDNLCWTCTRCKDVTSVKRPKFFDRFPSFSLEELLLLTYHWACKSRLWVINYDVPVHVERIWEYFNALQDLCGESVSRDRFIGKSSKHAVTVEVSAVKLGRFFILCAYDRRNKVSRLETLTTEEACSSLKHIKILEEWLGDNCTLITWKQLHDDFLPNVIKLSADPSIGHVQSPGRHILNASKYLGKTMVQLFQNINHEQLTLETVQRILNEVQWRERHGKNEESAFWEVLNEISRLNDTYIHTESQLGNIEKDRFYYKADVPFRLRWGPYDTAAKASITKNQFNSVYREPTVPAPSILAAQLTTGSNPSLPSINNSDDIVASIKKRHPISVSCPSVSKEHAIYNAPISAQELLSIKIVFTNDEKILKDHQRQANKLAAELKEQGYLQNPVRWFCKKKFLKDKSTCYVCSGPTVLKDNPKFTDGVSWLCQKTHCQFENEFQRPAFFNAIGFPLNVTLAVIFHWAMQSDYNVVTQAIPMNEFNILGVHRQIQKLCTDVQPSFKIGGKRQLVEVAFVRFANCFILGAMERNTKCSRFRTFSSEVKLHIDIIRKTLISWLWENSTVVVNSNKYLGRYSMEEKIHLVFADQSVTDVNSTLYHTLTITSYLQGHIKSMFQSTKVQKMSADLLQIYLDELMWRERYGKNPIDAFNGIMNAIFFQNKAPTPIDEDTLLMNAARHYGFSLPLPKLTISLEKLPEHVIHSYTTRVSNVESITIADEFESAKGIKEEAISDEEIEVDVVNDDEVQYVPNPVNISSSSSKTSIASSSSSAEANENRIITLELVNNELNSKKSVSLRKRSDSFSSDISRSSRRYADKCYSHRKKLPDLKDGKSRCIECRDTILEDHFVKQFSCGDCKCYVFTTHCQKAFARHRSYILFGRKISDDNVFNRSIRLPQKWYCSCGYGSKDGNKLASHLIKCKKSTSTCYKSSNPGFIL